MPDEISQALRVKYEIFSEIVTSTHVFSIDAF